MLDHENHTRMNKLMFCNVLIANNLVECPQDIGSNTFALEIPQPQIQEEQRNNFSRIRAVL